MQEIVNAVCRDIKASFPGVEIIVQNRRIGTVKPSFGVQVVKLEITDLNKVTTRESITVQVAYYLNNLSTTPEGSNLLIEYEKMKSIFMKGFLIVNDRHVPITRLQGGMLGFDVQWEGGISSYDMYLNIDFDLTGLRQDTSTYMNMNSMAFKQMLNK